ncbi:VOC family protein [Halioxenophilus sp. WMMB6]|uniref:VOC family protein n=1 Tax=Halioxenophilus sp. WMMB6 TaxID=3073815 RepID=UPI00295E39DF|nr:VOC family protein [Halioxenophilus sp. WMMB6]
MISHINLGSNDLPRAEAFYNEFLKLYSGQLGFKNERTLFYLLGDGSGAKLAINLPFNGEPATVGNGTMVALAAANPEEVKAVYSKAMALGASCDGEPGERMDGALYAAYFRDLDGNKFGVFCQMVS